jgi:2-polyprenyl-3-methyl-5-hydroxy-6-metoxy-1,4-benzoquinol methylase
VLDHKALQAQALAVRLFTNSLGAAELMTTYIGIHLGFYDVLAKIGPITFSQLAERTGIAPRYTKEWLEQQAASAVVEVDNITKPAEDRLYLLPAGHGEALTQTDSLFYIAPLTLLPVAVAQILPKLLDGYRAGTGLPFSEYGPEFRAGQSGLNRATFLYQLARWIKTELRDVHNRLMAGGARIADIGCGLGWSSIALAKAYPDVHVDGFDLDETSVSEARRNAGDSGVGDRVTFEVLDAAALMARDVYDLVCLFDALHDMARPVDVLQTCLSLLAADGAVLLMEPKVANDFTAPSNETERFMYAISVLHCLPVGLSEQPSAGTGTVMRPRILRQYATEAGFADVRVLSIEHPFYLFYRLVR